MNLEHCLLLNKTDGKVNSTKVFILWLLQNLPYKDEEDFPCIELVILLIILVGVGGAVMLICAVVEPTWRKKKWICYVWLVHIYCYESELFNVFVHMYMRAYLNEGLELGF